MTLTLTAENVSALGVPSIKLTALSTTTDPDPIPNNSLITVFRVHSNGNRHRVLTDQGPRLIGGGWTWLDIHAPYNQPLTYEVTAAGSTSTSNAIWLLSDQAWLIHPSQADLAVPVQAILKIGDRSTDTRSGRFQPVEGKTIFLSDGNREGVKGQLDLRVTDQGAFRSLFADDSVILINTPGTAGWDLRWMWVQPGQVSYSNPADLVPYKYRHISVPYEESADPDMDTEPVWTSADALAYWSSLGVNSDEVTSHYADCLDFLTNTQL